MADPFFALSSFIRKLGRKCSESHHPLYSVARLLGNEPTDFRKRHQFAAFGIVLEHFNEVSVLAEDLRQHPVTVIDHRYHLRLKHYPDVSGVCISTVFDCLRQRGQSRAVNSSHVQYRVAPDDTAKKDLASLAVVVVSTCHGLTSSRLRCSSPVQRGS